MTQPKPKPLSMTLTINSPNAVKLGQTSLQQRQQAPKEPSK